MIETVSFACFSVGGVADTVRRNPTLQPDGVSHPALQKAKSSLEIHLGEAPVPIPPLKEQLQL
jgi:hypothetical protein